MSTEAFTLDGTTTTLSATTSAPTPSPISAPAGRIRVFNSGTVIAFLRSGKGAADSTATTSHTPLAAGGVEVFSIPANHDNISAITASGTATVYVTVGDGI